MYSVQINQCQQIFQLRTAARPAKTFLQLTHIRRQTDTFTRQFLLIMDKVKFTDAPLLQYIRKVGRVDIKGIGHPGIAARTGGNHQNLVFAKSGRFGNNTNPVAQTKLGDPKFWLRFFTFNGLW